MDFGCGGPDAVLPLSWLLGSTELLPASCRTTRIGGPVGFDSLRIRDNEAEDNNIVDLSVKEKSQGEGGDEETDKSSDQDDYSCSESEGDYSDEDDYSDTDVGGLSYQEYKDLEEKWESQIIEHMKFPIFPASKILSMWKGSLQVEGPSCCLDPNLISMENFISPLPPKKKKKNMKEPCRRAIQLFGLNISSPHDVVEEIYGMFAFRDVRDCQERNFVFEYPRDKPFKLKPGSDKVQPLNFPPRGIYAVGPVLIEYHLMIKGQQGNEDKVLVDGYSVYCPSLYKEYARFHWHINTGHAGSVDLKMICVPNAVLAMLDIEVNHLVGNHYDSLAIVAAFGMARSQYMVFDGKVSVGRLRPVTVSIKRDRFLQVFLHGYCSSHMGLNNCPPDGVVSDYQCDGHFYDEDDDDVWYDTLYFAPEYGTTKKTSRSLKDMEVSVTVTWSSLY